MPGYVLHDQDGKAKSFTKLDPKDFPSSLTKVALSDADYDAIMLGDKLWDAATRSPVVNQERLAQQQEDAFTKDRIQQVLAKARAIMNDPVNAPGFTATETKVILAVMVLRNRG